MDSDRQHSIHGLLDGSQRGTGAALLLGILRCAEPFYAGAMRLRNWMYDRGCFSAHRVQAPVISVGNITAGGTGKTPVVCWLADRLRREGMHPAILLRGYKRKNGSGDEEDLLRESLSAGAPVIVHAQPDRVAGALQVLREHPEVNAIILDDGFQHRRLRRDFELVLIDATSPFGHGHVHPRGLLREPLEGLNRADAIVLTRCDLVPDSTREEIEQKLREMSPAAAIYRARHELAGMRSEAISAAAAPDLPIELLESTPFFAFAGIANPEALHRQLWQFGESYRAHHWFADHHAYVDDDLRRMQEAARSAGAAMLVVTEKDWRKLRRLACFREGPLPIRRLALSIQFGPPGEDGLVELIQTRIEKNRPEP